jgi:hypothetical protein
LKLFCGVFFHLKTHADYIERKEGDGGEALGKASGDKRYPHIFG